jgi:hypothetical protein
MLPNVISSQQLVILFLLIVIFILHFSRFVKPHRTPCRASPPPGNSLTKIGLSDIALQGK